MAQKPLISGSPRTEQRRQERLIAAIERRFEPRIAREIARAMREAVDFWLANGNVPALPEHRANIETIVHDMAKVAVRAFGARILMQQRGHLVVIERKDFAETLSRMAQRYIMLEGVRRHITEITETTRNQIITATQRGFDEGLGTDAIARVIRDVTPGLSRSRAHIIARTESHGAANYGANAAAKETGLQILKEWVASQDERTREAHAEADGQTVQMDEPFIVGGEALMYPGDPGGSAENVINCFAPWSLIAPIGLKAAIRRDYIGHLVELSLGPKINLTVTPNHPILTNRGWVLAGDVVEGDKVLYSGIFNSGEIGACLDVGDGSATAENIYNAAQGSGSMVRHRGVVVNFHGEVPDHDVNIVPMEGKLRDAMKAARFKPFEQITLAMADISKGGLSLFRRLGLSDIVSSELADCDMGRLSADASFFGGSHIGCTAVAVGNIRSSNAKVLEAAIHECPAQSVSAGDCINAVAIANHSLDDAKIGDARLCPSSIDTALCERIVKSVRIFHYEGPVYNFESDTGLLIADGIVNHNCRCAVAHTVIDE